MIPALAAYAFLKGAGSALAHLKQSQTSPPPQAVTPQGNPPVATRPKLRNAPNFAEVFGVQNTIAKADPLAKTIADRLVQVTHRPMRSEKMERFVALSRQAFVALAKDAAPTSPDLAEFQRFLKMELGLNTKQCDSLIAQIQDLAKADDSVQDNFLKTGGESLLLV